MFTSEELTAGLDADFLSAGKTYWVMVLPLNRMFIKTASGEKL